MSALTVVLVVVGVGTIVAYQGCITSRVLRNTGATTKHKVFQVVLLWLLPLVGAGIVHAFLISDKEIPKRQDENFIPSPGDGVG